MKLRAAASSRLEHFQQHVETLQHRRLEFVRDVAEMVGRTPTWFRHLKIEPAADGTSCRVVYASVTIDVRSQFILPPEGAARCQVTCVLESPLLDGKQSPVVLGSFAFDRAGNTDLEAAPGEEIPDVGWCGKPFVAHCLTVALERGLA